MIGKQEFVRMLQRERLPGDLVFAVVFLLISVILVSQLGDQATWVKRTKFFAQPAFWPTVSLIGMLFFAFLHCLGSWLSPKTPGRRPPSRAPTRRHTIPSSTYRYPRFKR